MPRARHLVACLATLLIGVFCATAGPAQGQGPDLVQPWGLPPLPAGVGPVEKFADVSGTPQGQFLEGGAFDTQGNLWFVAIGSGWVSYLTPDGKLVPAFNCNPPPELGQTCEPQGTRWFEGKLYLTTRHRGILVYDPQTKEVKTLVYTYRNQLFKGPNDLDFDAEGNLFFTDPWGTGPGPNLTDQTGAVYQYSRDGMLRKVMDSGLFPNGIAVSPDNALLAVGDFRGGRIWYSTFQNGPTMGCPQCPKDPSHSTFSSVKAGTFIPGNGGPDGMHYDVQRQPLGRIGRSRRHHPDQPARHHPRFCADTEQRRGNHQFRVRRPRQPVNLLGGGDQRNLLALQGALSRPDRPGRGAFTGATIRAVAR